MVDSPKYEGVDEPNYEGADSPESKTPPPPPPPVNPEYEGGDDPEDETPPEEEGTIRPPKYEGLTATHHFRVRWSALPAAWPWRWNGVSASSPVGGRVAGASWSATESMAGVYLALPSIDQLG